MLIERFGHSTGFSFRIRGDDIIVFVISPSIPESFSPLRTTKDFLLRGLTLGEHDLIRSEAAAQKVSMNQYLLAVVTAHLEDVESDDLPLPDVDMTPPVVETVPDSSIPDPV